MKFKKLTAVIAVITVAALLAAGCGSVSYTHLDVYKRQVVFFANIMPWRFSGFPQTATGRFFNSG